MPTLRGCYRKEERKIRLQLEVEMHEYEDLEKLVVKDTARKFYQKCGDLQKLSRPMNHDVGPKGFGECSSPVQY